MASHLIQARRELELGYRQILGLRSTIAKIDLALANYEEALAYRLGHRPAGMEDVQRILEEVCHELRVTPAAVLGTGRAQELVDARRLVLALAFTLTNHKWSRLASFLKRHRRSCRGLLDAHAALSDTDRAYAEQFSRLLRVLNPPPQEKASA